MYNDHQIPSEQNRSTENVFFKNKIWRIKDVADYLQCSKGHIYNLVSKREIPHKKKGGLLIFIPIEVENWLLEGDLT